MSQDKTSCRQEVHWKNVLWTKGLLDKKSHGQKVLWTKSPFEKNVLWTKRPMDKTSYGQKVLLKKTSYGQNVQWTKRPTDKTSYGQNVMWTFYGQNFIWTTSSGKMLFLWLKSLHCPKNCLNVGKKTYTYILGRFQDVLSAYPF